MKQISLPSNLTFCLKRVIPVLSFGVFVFGIVEVAANLKAPASAVAPVPVALVVLMGVFCVIVLRRVSDVVDEVWDDGDALIVKNATLEERVPLKNIINVDYLRFSNLPRVTVTLRDPSQFGHEIAFFALPTMGSFSNRLLSNRCPLVDELTERADVARRAAASTHELRVSKTG